ncbi:MAG TPA: M1 family metallopeptidase [Verrucomicrobiota bacterium]|nr:M1 family metallopeptidase [Verrucomicrobiota bacterium]HNU49943.1 M1 family metallopeptidase [Verrucomicrobiota bacterium]
MQRVPVVSSRRAAWLVVGSVLVSALGGGCRHPGLPDAPACSSAEAPDAGGLLLPEQARYDMRHVDLNLRVDPPSRSISGTATIDVTVTAPMAWLVLDLNRRLAVTSARRWQADGIQAPAPFDQRDDRLWVDLGHEIPAGARVVVAIDYGGEPQVAKMPPWGNGFTWATTRDKQPWIATSVQGEGADLWWPCNDHPSDEPESVALRITVPEPLVAACNGRLIEVTRNGDGTRTYHWHSALPVNTYNVALNIAPYVTVEGDYHSLGGEIVRATYWVLPENKAKGEKIFSEFLDHLRFYERLLGPYPCRREKYGVAETPHLGMEHQSIIAYGNRYQRGPQGFDWVHHHELGHEWWGNLVTAADWRHLWIHEGICTYMQALYAEEREGQMAYHHAMYEYRRKVQNAAAVVPERPTGAVAMFDRGTDAYYKGAWVIHMLRYLVGREAMLDCLRRFLYPTEESEHWGDTRAFRFVTTKDFERTVRQHTRRDLTWFFDVYLRQPELPELVRTVVGDTLVLHWKVPGKRPFPMPVEIEVDGKVKRFEMPSGERKLPTRRYAQGQLDPHGWILKKP